MRTVPMEPDNDALLRQEQNLLWCTRKAKAVPTRTVLTSAPERGLFYVHDLRRGTFLASVVLGRYGSGLVARSNQLNWSAAGVLASLDPFVGGQRHTINLRVPYSNVVGQAVLI